MRIWNFSVRIWIFSVRISKFSVRGANLDFYHPTFISPSGRVIGILMLRNEHAEPRGFQILFLNLGLNALSALFLRLDG